MLRLGALFHPLFARIGRSLAPWIARMRERGAPLAQQVRSKAAPWLETLRRALEDTTGGRHRQLAQRMRSMKVGAVAAAVGAVVILIGSVLGASTQERNLHDAVEAGPVPSSGVALPAVPAPPTAKPPASPTAPSTSAPSTSTTQSTQSSSQSSTQATAADPPVGPPVEGIDVSNHNGSIDWDKVAADGKKFAFVLASDGTTFVNPLYGTQYQGAKDAGLLVGAYHFARPDQSAQAQANILLSTADYKSDGKTLPPVVDLEIDPNGTGCYGLSTGQMQDWLRSFNRIVKQNTGKDPIIYANTSFWGQCMGGTGSFDNHNLWLASYGVSDPPVPSGFDRWDFWQYSAEGQVSGVSGYTDLNLYKDGLARLKKLASH